MVASQATRGLATDGVTQRTGGFHLEDGVFHGCTSTRWFRIRRFYEHDFVSLITKPVPVGPSSVMTDSGAVARNARIISNSVDAPT